MIRKSSFYILLLVFFCSSAWAQWNDPHQKANEPQVYYSAFTGPPKTLDPARAYSSDEMQFIAQIYEPPFQYSYLKRPYELESLTAENMPVVIYYNKRGKRVPTNTAPANVAYSTYDIIIRPGIYYQPHPALAKNDKGAWLYHHLSGAELKHIQTLSDFKQVGTKELTAKDYVYEIKRLASPKTHSPIFGVMSNYIIGFPEFGQKMQKELAKINKGEYLDLRNHEIEGVKVISRYHYQIKIKGVYPQFKYWLAMPFFSPIPWEADVFYSQPGLEKENITFDWYPIGTGPFMMTENNPNKQIVLSRNSHYHKDLYPSNGEPGDQAQGYLQLSGQKMPFIDKAIFVLDKESIPRWNKFLQGYYDRSGIAADSFDQAIKIGRDGQPYLTENMKKKGIRLQTAVNPSIYYVGFNMLDPVVGGYSVEKKKLRQAISIAMDYEEYIAIFLNGRGVPAQGPIPPGISGYTTGKKGINNYVYEWIDGKPKRKSITEARGLLTEAGYPGGKNPKTGKQLILNYDVATTGSPDDKARFSWLRKQFAKLGIQLNIRATLYNRFRDKVRTGKAQIFSWGWNADYPDPENFLFLLYGANSKVKHGGENASNYMNPKADALFEEIRSMPDGEKRQKKIYHLVHLLQKDSPWIWGFYPVDFVLSQQWNSPAKPNSMANNSLKYQKIDVEKRAELRHKWNHPIFWPIVLLAALGVVIMIPVGITYWRRERRSNVEKFRKK
jgi:oligopeptide transport system substrate-binding protein